jgi:hypothetical protein
VARSYRSFVRPRRRASLGGGALLARKRTCIFDQRLQHHDDAVRSPIYNYRRCGHTCAVIKRPVCCVARANSHLTWALCHHRLKRAADPRNKVSFC